MSASPVHSARVRRSNDGSPINTSSSSSAASSSSSAGNTNRLQPIRATVPYQLLRGNQQHSPTRPPASSSFSSSSISVGSNTEPTAAAQHNSSSSGSPTLASPAGNGSLDGRLIPRQRRSPPEHRSSPERCPHSPVLRGRDGKNYVGNWRLSVCLCEGHTGGLLTNTQPQPCCSAS
ncbi:Glucocorticoid-induced transcript 1 protein [Anabarilius grahami]|uniref:Glucocorticoid-induced transcript 1 protein n=1 Tax=Anabarilius grahami TaxID=495550 RepID=A0A3N0XZ92_ANAGA|nr:Glucocorticoid-induced transcript 1 protein [Anabarilius grahami]